MKTKTRIFMLAALAVAVGIAIRATSKIASQQSQRAALAAQHNAWRSKIAALEQRLRLAQDALADAEKNVAALPKNNAGKKNSAATTAVQAPDKFPPASRKLSPASLVANDPEKMAAYARNFRDSLDFTLGGMFRRLGLSPEQIEKVKDLRVWFEQSRMELEAAAEAHGLNMQGDAYGKLRWEDLGNARKMRETEIFGASELLEHYRNYSRLGYLRDTVQRIASSEMGSDTPATFAQVERAVDILAANNQRREPKTPEKWSWQIYGWSWGDWGAINWSAAEPQLQRELSPAQFGLLRQFLRTQEAWAAVASRNAANQREATRLARQPGG